MKTETETQSNDVKAKKVKAFTLIAGDTIGSWDSKNGKRDAKANFYKNTISSISELDSDFLDLRFVDGGFRIYGRRNFVNKVI